MSVLYYLLKLFFYNCATFVIGVRSKIEDSKNIEKY